MSCKILVPLAVARRQDNFASGLILGWQVNLTKPVDRISYQHGQEMKSIELSDITESVAFPVSQAVKSHVNSFSGRAGNPLLGLMQTELLDQKKMLRSFIQKKLATYHKVIFPKDYYQFLRRTVYVASEILCTTFIAQSKRNEFGAVSVDIPGVPVTPGLCSVCGVGNVDHKTNPKSCTPSYSEYSECPLFVDDKAYSDWVLGKINIYTEIFSRMPVFLSRLRGYRFSSIKRMVKNKSYYSRYLSFITPSDYYNFLKHNIYIGANISYFDFCMSATKKNGVITVSGLSGVHVPPTQCAACRTPIWLHSHTKSVRAKLCKPGLFAFYEDPTFIDDEYSHLFQCYKSKQNAQSQVDQTKGALKIIKEVTQIPVNVISTQSNMDEKLYAMSELDSVFEAFMVSLMPLPVLGPLLSEQAIRVLSAGPCNSSSTMQPLVFVPETTNASVLLPILEIRFGAMSAQPIEEKEERGIRDANFVNLEFKPDLPNILGVLGVLLCKNYGFSHPKLNIGRKELSHPTFWKDTHRLKICWMIVQQRLFATPTNFLKTALKAAPNLDSDLIDHVKLHMSLIPLSKNDVKEQLGQYFPEVVDLLKVEDRSSFGEELSTLLMSHSWSMLYCGLQDLPPVSICTAFAIIYWLFNESISSSSWSPSNLQAEAHEIGWELNYLLIKYPTINDHARNVVENFSKKLLCISDSLGAVRESFERGTLQSVNIVSMKWIEKHRVDNSATKTYFFQLLKQYCILKDHKFDEIGRAHV